MDKSLTTDEMLTARRELTAKKLADLGWEEGVSAGGKACAFETIDGRRTNRILNANVNWYICGGPLEPHATFDAAVDAAHAARFGRTAELNEPITHVEPDGDTCQTSELDLLRAENERLRAALSEAAAALGNGSSVSPDCSVEFLREVPGEVKAVVSGLHAELATANERAATLEREIDRLRLQPGQPVATFDGKEWTVEVGGLRVLIAWMSSDTVAEIDGWGKPAEEPELFTGRDRADTIALVNALLAFRGIRVQE
jgi:hypothetical protein